MTIYDSYDNVLLETKVSDKSSLYCGLDNKDRLTLHFTLDRHVEIPIGAWCNFEGNRYEVMSDADVKMNHTENYDYTVVLSSYFDLTARYKVRNMVDRRLKFDLVAKPHEHLKMIVDNLNARGGGWSIGSCIDSVEKLISYNHTNCEEALVNIANTFNTEIEVVGKVVSLKKVEYFKDDPLALSYGKGNGFRPGIQRTSVEDGLPVERLFVQGGNRNISLKEYGSSELHLPKSLSFKFDGNKFDGEDGFNKDHAKSFVTDSDGMSVAVEGMAGGREDSLDLSEVYPSRVGKVTGVVFIFKGKEYTTPNASWTADDWNEVQIDIVDDTIPGSLDFNECLMENNDPLTVVFQSGMLAGRELNANYLSDKKRFQLIKQEFDGQYMPQESFIPKKDDSYAVFNVYLPASYISDATTYSGAEYDMLREASRYLYEKCVSEFTFAGEIDGMWAKKNWDTIGPRMRIGSYVSFTHEKMFPDEPALVRIVGITQYVNNPHYPKIELSNSVGVSTVSSRLNQIENKDAHVAELYEEARRYTKRRYADIKQTIEMLSDAFDNYSEGINPITVETMLAVVGDKSLQYLFTKSIDIDDPVALEYSFDPNDGVFSVSDAFIKHMTLEIDSISPVHSNDEYLRWNVAAYASESLEKDSGYYLYAKVSKESQQGVFLLSKESIKLEAEEGYYNLLVGILNAEVDGERSFASMYGFTEILPGQITTDTIKSADGNTWLDLLKGILYLNNMAGVSGVKTEEKGDQSIAAWFGGLMKDIELDNDKENAAKSLIRHDGTGYFADGLFKWDRTNGVNLGNDAIKINYDGSVDFGGNIRIGSTGEETLDSLLTIVAGLTDMWFIDKDGNVRTKRNVVIEGDTASGGSGGDAVLGVTSIIINGETKTPTDGVIDLGTVGGGGIHTIKVNGTEYSDTNSDGIIDLGTISGGGVSGDYLPLTGGTIKNGSVRNPLTIDTNGVGAYMNFAANGTIYGYVGVNTTRQFGLFEYSNGSTLNGIYVSLTSIGLGTSNPTLGKEVQIDSSTWDGFLALNRTVAGGGASISCYANGSHLGNFGIDGSGYFEVNGNNSTTNFWVNANNGQTAIGYTAHPNFCQFDVNGSGRFATKVLSPDYITQAAHYVNISSVGWYRIAVADNSITGLNAIVSIRRSYSNTNNEAYVFSISCAYNGQTTITQISGHINYKLISQIRVVNPSSGTKAIDIYYNGTALNTVYVNCIGDFKGQTPTSVAASQTGATTMSISSSGMATSGDMVVHGDTASGSDIRFKDKIEDIRLDLDTMANAPLFTFKWNNKQEDDVHIGGSAQYWEECRRELVTGDDFKTLNYTSLNYAMVVSLAKEVKELKEEIKRLKEGN